MDARSRNSVIVALTTAGAIAGGLLASQFWDLGLARLLLLLAFGTVLGVAVALRWLTTETGQNPFPPTETRPPSEQVVFGVAAPQPHTAAPNHAVALPLPGPKPTGTGGQAWWEKAPGQAADTRRNHPADAPPLSSYDANRAVFAQCPHCGDFRLDVHHDGDGYAFDCRNPACGNQWHWSAGTAWPTTVIRRNLTRDQGR